jgi:hypothetical protein
VELVAEMERAAHTGPNGWRQAASRRCRQDPQLGISTPWLPPRQCVRRVYREASSSGRATPSAAQGLSGYIRTSTTRVTQ